ncbi:MAG: hypothetical protein JO301_00140 [Chitinophagaceae bacterium]|nr:hypothetical protein [Chitinophagaceae bacterium]
MTHARTWMRLLCAATVLIFVSCNSGTDKQAKADSTPPAAAPTPAPLKEEVLVKLKMTNFAKWKMNYDQDQANRAAAGLHDHIVGRGSEDSNTVFLVLYMDDTAKAKAFGADPKLKDKMKQSGVVGAPEVNYVHRVMTDTTAGGASMDRLLIRHKVKDFDTWKKVFDDHKQARMDAGLADRMLGYSIDNRNDVTIVMAITDQAKAKAFMNSKDLADKMKAGGVEGTPSFFFYHTVEKK